MSDFNLHNADCLDIMETIEDNSVDAVITDPPYELGFMGKSWDSTGIAYNVDLWKDCLRVLKPGGYLLAFGGARTYHRLACAIEDAGFEIRDQVLWLYGSGFPKGRNIGKAADKILGNDGKVGKGKSEWEGWNTNLKPAHEPICMARKPISEKTIARNCLKWGVGAINVDGCRVPLNGEKMSNGYAKSIKNSAISTHEGWTGPWMKDKNYHADKIKKATEKANECGRYPANLIHDGSDCVKEIFPETSKARKTKKTDNRYSASRYFYCAKASKKERNQGLEEMPTRLYGQSGGAQRAIKNNKTEYLQDNIGLNKIKKAKNIHPTVKPLALMKHLVTMISREKHTVLDPFMGSGTTGKACMELGRNFIGIEVNEDYYNIAKKRIDKENNKLNLF